jgi:ClpP class serine protease
MLMPHIAARMFNRPLLVEPGKAAAILAGLGARVVGGRIELRLPEGMARSPQPESRPSSVLGRSGVAAPLHGRRPQASILGGEAAHSEGGRPFALRHGIAVIPVTGTLVHRGAWIGESSGQTSYEGLAAQLDAALSDPVVTGIALEIDSHGGEVAGAFDLADRIRAARARKPVCAFVAESALSAGYAIASQADRIIVPRTGEVGSIGVVTMHVDMSGALEDGGYAVTLIHAGARKIDGNPFEPLPDTVRAEWQADLESVRQLFAATVEAGRGARLSRSAALATEAAILRGADAVAVGLADEVADLRAAFEQFASEARSGVGQAIKTASRVGAGALPFHAAQCGTTTRKELSMDDETTTEVEPQEATTIGQPDEVGALPATASDAAASGGALPPVMSRAEAAALAEVGAQAARVGVTVDVAAAMRAGTSADALRAQVLAALAERAEATAVTPERAAPQGRPAESPIVARARAVAEAEKARRAVN